MAYLDILTLVVLLREPAHGYEIRRRVERIVAGTVALNPNFLYPALHRFEAMGALEKRIEAQPGRPPRHVYSLTERGHGVLYYLLHDFGSADALDETEFDVRVAFFDFLDTEERLGILSARESALAARLHRFEGFAQEGEMSDWRSVVLDHAIDRTRLEQAWVAALRERAGLASSASSA